MGPIGCPETSVKNYRYSLRNSPNERSSLVLRLCNHTSQVTHIYQRFTCTAVQITMPAGRNLKFLLHSFPVAHIQIISTAVLAPLHFVSKLLLDYLLIIICTLQLPDITSKFRNTAMLLFNTFFLFTACSITNSNTTCLE